MSITNAVNNAKNQLPIRHHAEISILLLVKSDGGIISQQPHPAGDSHEAQAQAQAVAKCGRTTNCDGSPYDIVTFKAKTF